MNCMDLSQPSKFRFAPPSASLPTAPTKRVTDWAIQHYHESINFEAIFGNLVQDILELDAAGPATASDGSTDGVFLDNTKFEEIVSTLDPATAESFKEQMAPFIK